MPVTTTEESISAPAHDHTYSPEVATQKSGPVSWHWKKRVNAGHEVVLGLASHVTVVSGLDNVVNYGVTTKLATWGYTKAPRTRVHADLTCSSHLSTPTKPVVPRVIPTHTTSYTLTTSRLIKYSQPQRVSPSTPHARVYATSGPREITSVSLLFALLTARSARPHRTPAGTQSVWYAQLKLATLTARTAVSANSPRTHMRCCILGTWCTIKSLVNESCSVS